jgi:hypothetical protein
MGNPLLNAPKGVYVGEALRQGNDTRIAWQGVTTDNVATEIFLDGESSRLVIPTDTVVVGEGLFTAWNETDSAVLVSGRFAVSVRNIAGTVAANGTTLEWDAASTDANPFVQYFVGSAGVVFAYNNTTKSLTLTVTGTAAKTIRWKAELLKFIAQAL